MSLEKSPLRVFSLLSYVLFVDVSEHETHPQLFNTTQLSHRTVDLCGERVIAEYLFAID